jgi:hypothetical protein
MAPLTFLAVFNVIYRRLYFEFRQNVLISFMVPFRITRRSSHEHHFAGRKSITITFSYGLMVHASHRTGRAKVLYRRIRVCFCTNVGFKTAFMRPMVFVYFVFYANSLHSSPNIRVNTLRRRRVGHVPQEMHTKFWSDILKARDHLEHLVLHQGSATFSLPQVALATHIFVKGRRKN